MAKAWYVLSVYSGYENKVERFARIMMEEGELNVICDIKVPIKEDIETKSDKDGKMKKVVVKRKLLPGYILLEMDIPDRAWKPALAPLHRIQGVVGFLGQAEGMKPQPISNEEAKSILQKAGEIKGEKAVSSQTFFEGEKVRVIDGAFSKFEGVVKEVDLEKGKLVVVIGVFGRDTPIDIEFNQIEHV